jgi:hypothetical protein
MPSNATSNTFSSSRIASAFILQDQCSKSRQKKRHAACVNTCTLRLHIAAAVLYAAQLLLPPQRATARCCGAAPANRFISDHPHAYATAAAAAPALLLRFVLHRGLATACCCQLCHLSAFSIACRSLSASFFASRSEACGTHTHTHAGVLLLHKHGYTRTSIGSSE